MGKIKVCPVCGTLKGGSSKESRYCKCEKLKIMNPITETLEKFNNGEQRYEDDQNFKEAVDSLAAKIGVYAVLDKTLNQLRVLREIHAKNVALDKKLAEEADNLRKENQRLEDECDSLTADNLRLKDETASYKDALDLVSQARL